MSSAIEDAVFLRKIGVDVAPGVRVDDKIDSSCSRSGSAAMIAAKTLL